MAIGDKFRCTFQYAHHNSNESEDKGRYGLDEFIRIVETFPWAEQVAKADELQKVSPTICAINDENGFVYFVCGMSCETGVTYMLGFVSKEERKGFLGLGKGPKERLRTTDDAVLSDAIEGLRRFFARDYEYFKQRFS